MIKTRVLTSADLPTVLRLKTNAGWNQLPPDVERFLYLEPQGCFLAEWDGQPVGTACGFLFGPIAWIAMVLVDEAHRGLGIGRALMNRVLEFVDGQGATTVRLDATALGRPLYETLGFSTQFKLTRYHSPSVVGGEFSPEVTPLSAERLSEVLDLDRQVTCTERSKLIRRLYAETPGEFRMVLRGGRIAGYIAGRPGSNARQIGPSIASGDVGTLLLADALQRAAGQAVYIDVPESHPQANSWLLARGFAPQRELLRMSRGATILENVDQLWASSGPEKG